MSAAIIDGKAIAKEIKDGVAVKVEELKAKGIEPGLAVIIVGEDPASKVYVRNKARACKECGIKSQVIRLPEETTQDELIEVIHGINADDSVHGLLVQLPLPRHISEKAVLAEIDWHKDVDGFHLMNAGALLTGQATVQPCTPAGCIELLKRSNVKLDGANAVVIGRSNIVGKPMALLLLQNNCTVTVCHSHTKNLKEIVAAADVVVAAIGKPRFVTADMIKEGAAVIDVGINRLEDGSLCGDVDFEGAAEKAACITPVPGGVGPMTIAMLMENTLKAAEAKA